MKLTDRQLATVLDALRSWQVDQDKGLTPYWLDYFTDDEPLTAQEVDDLCEQINIQIVEGHQGGV